MPNARTIQDVRQWTCQQIGLPAGARVAVAMSGGVDSSVVAALLVEAGYDVIGLTARLYDTEATEVPRAGSCCAPEDARDAKGVAAQLGFRHYVLDERQSFREEVIAPFIDSWRTGQTPNPCVACNRSLKFDRLLQRALSLGAQVLATGHYAQLDADEGGRPRLRRGMDRGKDQAYFLYPLPASQATLLRFPLGGLSKADVRDHAERLGLNVAQKAESMDICFVGAKKPADWMADQGHVPSGDLVSLDGTRLGRHNNLAKFTVGQRRGLGLPGGSSVRYVVDKKSDGTVIVGDRDALRVSTLDLQGYNPVTGAMPEVGDRFGLQVRHRGKAIMAEVQAVSDAALTMRPLDPLMGAARGQAGVLFQDDRVIGGGTIESVTRASEV